MLVETAAEIVAKKLYHRGNQVKGRDVFDLSLVIEKEPESLINARDYLLRHRDVFLSQLVDRRLAIRTEFDAIDTLDYQPSFEDCVARVNGFLREL